MKWHQEIKWTYPKPKNPKNTMWKETNDTKKLNETTLNQGTQKI